MKFPLEREQCIKCKNPAVSICPQCGLLCQQDDSIHRHETDHITELLNWEVHAQPNAESVKHDRLFD